MIIFRVISLVIIAAALMLLGADALTSLETGETTMRSLAEVLDLLSPGSAGGLSAWSTGALPGAVAPAVTAALAAPAWVPLGILGLILALIFRARD